MLGWKIFVLKYILGGIIGYSEVRLILTRKICLAYGVSGGPSMKAYQLSRSLSLNISKNSLNCRLEASMASFINRCLYILMNMFIYRNTVY